jgi:RNA polymerase sigma factor (sigma-70 family)
MNYDLDANAEVPVELSPSPVDNAEVPESRLPSDRDLLREYAATNSDATFSRLMARHVNLVYSAAMRQVRNHAMAQDVTQAVFIVLARKAASLRQETVLAGWLLRAVRYAALDALKIEVRRHVREEEAARMETTDALPDSEVDWPAVAPLLDEALATLKPRDRQAVLLRFFEKRNFGEIGAVLGGNENSARVRVLRAMEKLRRFLLRRGFAVSAVALGSALLGHAVQAAPAAVLATLMRSPAEIPETVTRMADAVHRRFQRESMVRAGAILALLLVALLVWLPQLLPEAPPPAAPPTARSPTLRETIINLELTLANDPNGFAALIHYRDAQEERFRPVLVDYARAQAEFRDVMRRMFRSQQRAFNIAFNELCVGQPPILQQYIGPNRVDTNLMQAGYPVHLIRVDTVWKWDLFSGLSSEARQERIAVLQQKARLFDALTTRIRQGTLTNATDAIKAFHNATP